MKYIIVDSREKPKAIERTLQYFSDHGIDYEVSKLLFGDYMDWNRPQLVIDRKQNIAELAKNCTREHDRFRRELEKAQKAGATLVILVEQNTYKDGTETLTLQEIESVLSSNLTSMCPPKRKPIRSDGFSYYASSQAIICSATKCSG